ncbi:MAG: hypothetical protein WC527_00625 [Candidatus Margulisiibacteriota bacterium]
MRTDISVVNFRLAAGRVHPQIRRNVAQGTTSLVLDAIKHGALSSADVPGFIRERIHVTVKDAVFERERVGCNFKNKDWISTSGRRISREAASHGVALGVLADMAMNGRGDRALNLASRLRGTGSHCLGYHNRETDGFYFGDKRDIDYAVGLSPRQIAEVIKNFNMIQHTSPILVDLPTRDELVSIIETNKHNENFFRGLSCVDYTTFELAGGAQPSILQIHWIQGSRPLGAAPFEGRWEYKDATEKVPFNRLRWRFALK